MGRFIYPICSLNKVPYGLCKFSVPMKWWLLHKTATHYVPSDLISGTSVDLIDSGYFAPIEFNIEGNSIQEGTPSPESEVPINSVGDNENLFNDTLEVGTINSSGNNSSSTDNMRSAGETTVDENTTYAVNSSTQCSIAIRYYDNTKTFLSSGTTDISPNKFTTPQNCKYVRFVFVGITDTTIKVKLEKGEVATPYSPYNMGVATIEKCNKNLLSAGTQLNGYRNIDNSKFVTNANAVGYYFPTQILPNKITFNATSGNRANVSYYNDIPANNVVAQDYTNSNTLPRTITIDKTYKYIHIQFSYNETNLSNIQVEGGETSTTYITPSSTTYSIYTQAPMRSIGDVRDDFVKQAGVWYERHKIGKSLFLGAESENWIFEQLTGGRNNFYIGISEALKGNSNRILNNIGIYNSTLENNYNCYISGGGNLNYLCNEINNLADFKTMLASTNMIVIYQLAEPTLTECTNEQVEQLEKITSDRLYKGGTSFYSEDLVPPYLEVQYYTAESTETSEIDESEE